MVEVIVTDVAVLGGGSAGCAAVDRLLALGCPDVMLIEAGPDYGSHDPEAWPPELLDATEIPASHDWGVVATAYGDRAFPHERARVIGGCSSHNECAAVWGMPRDYDAWATLLDDPSWSWQALAGQVDGIEDAGPPLAGRGSGGRLPTRRYVDAELTVWGRTFLDAAQAAGYPVADDVADPALDSLVTRWYTNARDKTRWNAAFAFVDPHRADPRLRVRGDLTVDRLILDQGRAVAAVLRDETGGEVEIRARSFVLTAGAVGTPAVLLRSGIGPADELARHGIDVVVDLPGVGHGLQDHVGVGLAFGLTDAAQTDFDARLAAKDVVQSQVVVRTPNRVPEVGGDLHLLPYEVPGPDGRWLHLMVAFLMNPLSSGSVVLAGADPTLPPVVDAGYFTDPGGHDLESLVRGVALLRDIASRQEYADLSSGEAAWSRHLASDALADYVQGNFVTYGHLAGTARMGAPGDPLAVADARGLVRGTANVVVADVSAMPTILSANTNLTAMLMGRKLAESALA